MPPGSADSVRDPVVTNGDESCHIGRAKDANYNAYNTMLMVSNEPPRETHCTANYHWIGAF